ncbi:MAG: hypothetical protein RL154_12 [Pseudomonadota bacterium]|jgi:thiosulfate/3-mercaptopyruvate sulfurtransferase
MRKFIKTFIIASSLFAALSFAADTQMTISANEAKGLLGKPNVVFVMGDTMDVYVNGHPAGSVVMDAHHLHHSDITGHMHCAPLYMCPDEAEKFIGPKGIDNNTTIIAFDDYKGPNASGVWHYFQTYGHKNVYILDGGMQQLKAVGVPMVKGDEGNITAKKFVIKPSDIDTSMVVTKEEVLVASDDIAKNGNKSQYIIIDTRRMVEIIGTSKIDNVARGGHVPYSEFIEWTNFSDKDKKMSYKSPEEMQKVLDKYGVTKDKTIYTYCHVGVGRSSYVYSVLQKLGYKNIKVYSGSWDEWGNDFNMPIHQ